MAAIKNVTKKLVEKMFLEINPSGWIEWEKSSAAVC